ncbi:hypothetical protein BDN72DRAFT_899526 [Pluteus cervinus]|uniref:Uncharacterized protein n=1 Tax=Pluteus cervinus TaxID=181527 RepID=A0ACD3ANE6_9AGAR|nr:hypothetical protein BDN72DRAFT_899526 [Pluteus cervinus]
MPATWQPVYWTLHSKRFQKIEAFTFISLCLVAQGQKSLESLWERLHDPDRQLHDKRVDRLLTRLNSMQVVAGLILTADAVFLTTAPPDSTAKWLKYDNVGSYHVVMISFVTALTCVVTSTIYLLIATHAEPEWLIALWKEDRLKLMLSQLLMSSSFLLLLLSILFCGLGGIIAGYDSDCTWIVFSSIAIPAIGLMMATVTIWHLWPSDHLIQAAIEASSGNSPHDAGIQRQVSTKSFHHYQTVSMSSV